jgi:hypothetical protein
LCFDHHPVVPAFISSTSKVILLNSSGRKWHIILQALNQNRYRWFHWIFNSIQTVFKQAVLSFVVKKIACACESSLFLLLCNILECRVIKLLFF